MRDAIGTPLPADFYARSSREVAPDLLGMLVRSTLGGAVTVGRIVETEAYIGPEDPASHAAERIGRTARNATMFGPPGTAYVYLSYGMHWCLNAVTARVGHPCAVLIRALEPVSGLDTMRARRGTPDRDLARGPGRLTQALGITGALDGHALHTPPLTIEEGPPIDAASIEAGPRVGISRAADWPLRFTVRGSPWVSPGPRVGRAGGRSGR
ncbi:MAG TPA: DNA-3-methyladenine glycosylase [Longimicrobiales bacterium]|nr:DNA-3-methyladenine glycosylase [Longimicrobiales bacterium]